MPRSVFAIAFITCMLFFTPQARTAGVQIGVVDVEYVVLNSNAGQSAKSKLKKSFDTKQKELDARQKSLLEQKSQLENPSAMVSQEARQKKVRQYQQEILKLQEEVMRHQQELARQEQDLMQPILQSLEKHIERVAKKRKLDVILNKNQHGVIYSKPSFDITKEVLNALNKG